MNSAMLRTNEILPKKRSSVIFAYLAVISIVAEFG
jgi:hypothetical protein